MSRENREFSVHKVDAIDDYLQREYKRPTKWPWLDSRDDPAPDVQLDVTVAKVIKISLPKGLFRRATLASRYEYATWHWLKPSLRMALKDINLLKTICGLNHVDDRTFVEQLSLYCLRAGARHPPLVRWVKMRTALLELLTFQEAAISNEMTTAQSAGLYNLFAAICIQKLGQASRSQGEDLPDILSSIAVEARRILSRSGRNCRLSANLMVALPLDEDVLNGSFLPWQPRKTASIARELWGEDGANAEKCLLVVAETERDQHVGFWVPLITSSKGETLPGACRAYKYESGVSVFKNDLPDLKDLGFSAKLDHNWRSYLGRHVDERMFVSIPVRTPIRRSSLTNRVVAVVNINADPADQDDWLRAYHREWLDIVEKNTNSLLTLCCYSFLADKIGGENDSLLDKRPEILNIAPYLHPKRLPSPRDFETNGGTGSSEKENGAL